MKRYTFNSGDDYYAISGDECFDDQDENYCGPAIDKLAKYEDLEEAGRLAILPCKIGDIVYQPGYKFTACTAYGFTPKYKHDCDCEGCEAECDSQCRKHIYSGKVSEIKILSNGTVAVKSQFNEKWDNSTFYIGVDIFLTEEEAAAFFEKR